MDSVTVLVLAFGIGIICGLRAFSGPATVSWGAHLHWLRLEPTSLAFFGYTATTWILSAFALGEIVNDKLPKTPSRKAPAAFGARIVTGAVCGAALCLSAGNSAIVGCLVGAVGAVAGTLGGYEARTRLVKALQCPDYVVALLEDAVAVGGGLLIVSRFQ
jgi:uncharacterized membrane protein